MGCTVLHLKILWQGHVSDAEANVHVHKITAFISQMYCCTAIPVQSTITHLWGDVMLQSLPTSIYLTYNTTMLILIQSYTFAQLCPHSVQYNPRLRMFTSTCMDEHTSKFCTAALQHVLDKNLYTLQRQIPVLTYAALTLMYTTQNWKPDSPCSTVVSVLQSYDLIIF